MLICTTPTSFNASRQSIEFTSRFNVSCNKSALPFDKANNLQASYTLQIKWRTNWISLDVTLCYRELGAYFLNNRSGRLEYCPNNANKFRFISKSNWTAPPAENFVFIIILSTKKSSNWWAIIRSATLNMLSDRSVSKLCSVVTINCCKLKQQHFSIN